MEPRWHLSCCCASRGCGSCSVGTELPTGTGSAEPGLGWAGIPGAGITWAGLGIATSLPQDSSLPLPVTSRGGLLLFPLLTSSRDPLRAWEGPHLEAALRRIPVPPCVSVPRVTASDTN